MPEEEQGRTFGMQFDRNAQNPLEADVIIIDEMSMVDIQPDAFPASGRHMPAHRLILVGDENQLPSVGPGNVLRDIIHSRMLSCGRAD